MSSTAIRQSTLVQVKLCWQLDVVETAEKEPVPISQLTGIEFILFDLGGIFAANTLFQRKHTGHFALEEDGDVITTYMRQVLASRLQPVPA